MTSVFFSSLVFVTIVAALLAGLLHVLRFGLRLITCGEGVLAKLTGRHYPHVSTTKMLYEKNMEAKRELMGQ